ncbi:deoxycytidylate deaminase-like [Copidosoma floridanum]|uniref:deoxycytidylate deaminase n=1 Tax=Copidosoma floridanum TaxID=29053 RepID=UPI0006C96C7B|nr:deoxycytidylate deaminase [Copidosoma floridanum]XP_023247533.1 deoxycytidylate deaminase-like [Copidosoma floridanum]
MCIQHYDDVVTTSLKIDQIKLNDSPQSSEKQNDKRDVNSRRLDYINWDDYFMAVAFLAAMRSKDPCSQVGACIVNNEKKIVGVGYNGMPNGCSDNDFPWKKHSDDPLENKFLYVCHAELNAILNKQSESVKNCTLYVALFPCNECAKVIIQSGIKKIYYLSDKHSHKISTKASKRMLDAANVKYSQYKPAQEKIVIDFTAINWNNMNQLPESPDK